MLNRFQDQIEKALASGGSTHTFANIEQAVREGQMQAWYGPKSVILTEIVDYPTGHRHVNFVLAAGVPGEALRELRTMQRIVQEWAKGQGCTRAVFTGRDGWSRTFLTQEEGWEPVLRVFAKDL